MEEDSTSERRESREGSLSRAIMVALLRLAAMEESDGREKRSYAPSRGSDEHADVVLGESLERRAVQADESSNLDGEEDLEDVIVSRITSSSLDVIGFSRVGLSTSLGSDLSFTVNCTERLNKIISSWRLLLVADDAMAP